MMVLSSIATQSLGSAILSSTRRLARRGDMLATSAPGIKQRYSSPSPLSPLNPSRRFPPIHMMVNDLYIYRQRRKLDSLRRCYSQYFGPWQRLYAHWLFTSLPTLVSNPKFPSQHHIKTRLCARYAHAGSSTSTRGVAIAEAV